MDLFSQQEGLARIELTDGELLVQPHFYCASRCRALFTSLEQLNWQQQAIQMFGKSVMQPRLQFWCGDKPYTYSGLTLPATPWPRILLAIKSEIEQVSGYQFNSVLGNLYRDGQDYMGWHSDDEPELGSCPVIASLSLGQTRRFLMRHKQTGEKHEFALGDGCLLIMAGATQHHWLHQIAKTQRQCEPRINLTFRYIPNQPGDA
ncbi:alpha-ketoglutarate-dependent dioxygenase AlkB family protein [Motilimonas eburnea]|uniref:alpha-ketoglutarate-dependent dioxygenase AlkB family protein n=1 Tax=Motilimonas eburnea TaxID=1737488 RepID=UPI001E45BFD9|nr:alpha-ketoglutarate-dependent dioxygenase AlkB [Motilimonas eburnea]MCE2569932.1 alpha-ketoglutarate-dependent dioxygenase AlkB [Motilimonas eburnea]